MTLNTILQTCGKCEAKYRELYAQEPRLSDDEIIDEINKFNQEHNCLFHNNYLSDIKIYYDIYLKTGQTIYAMEHDICEQSGKNNSTELKFTKFDKTTEVRHNFACNANDIIAIGEHYQAIASKQEEKHNTVEK